MLQIGGISHASGAISVVQRVVERVLSFHDLFGGKYKWKIRVGNELRGMYHLYVSLWRFLYENFYHFPEGALEACPYLHVPRVQREPKYSLIEFVEAAKTMENWVSIQPCSRLPKLYDCLNNRWLDLMALSSADSCSKSKFRTYNSRKSTLNNMRGHWRISPSINQTVCLFTN